MRTGGKALLGLAAVLVTGLWAAAARANGGPFVIKYPEGDPAARGVLARLEPDLRPGTETRLRVLKEDLKIVFENAPFGGGASGPPLVNVSAAYEIENPTEHEVAVDLGFPILRGIYVSPIAMNPLPNVTVTLDGRPLPSQIIGNSQIYGLIRRWAREVVDRGIAEDKTLFGLVRAVGAATDADRPEARRALAQYLVDGKHWSRRDAILMSQYAGLDFGRTEEPRGHPADRVSGMLWTDGDESLANILNENLGPLTAIGEQKATQLFAYLANRFDPGVAASYEKIFQAWGGDVRERSVDLETGQVRPREIHVDREALEKREGPFTRGIDPTLYARVDYLDPNAKLTEAEKESCRTILEHLPVVFTFAPMNLVHYQARFPPGAKRTLIVSYPQFAYADTARPASYQVVYVVHPASLWREFGPIHLTVFAPEAVPLKASVPCRAGETQEWTARDSSQRKLLYRLYSGTVEEKTGELFIGLERAAWEKAMSRTSSPKQAGSP